MATRNFIPCATCGATFKQTIDARRFCCRACYDKDREIQPKICQHCGKSYTKQANQKGSKFCSEVCQMASRRVLPHTCVTCGALFSPVKYKKSLGRFVGATGRHNCSKQCIDAWKAKTKSAYMRANVERFTGPNNWAWKGSGRRANRSFRGHEWKRIAESVRKRDKFMCTSCGMTNDAHLERWNQSLEVHHLIPFCEFTDYKKANLRSNLTSLCKSCHMTADRAIKVFQLDLGLDDSCRKKRKDGVSRGESNGRATIKEIDAVNIRATLRKGVRHADVAKEFSVSIGVVRGISAGKTWKHVI